MSPKEIWGYSPVPPADIDLTPLAERAGFGPALPGVFELGCLAGSLPCRWRPLRETWHPGTDSNDVHSLWRRSPLPGEPGLETWRESEESNPHPFGAIPVFDAGSRARSKTLPFLIELSKILEGWAVVETANASVAAKRLLHFAFQPLVPGPRVELGES